MAAPESKKSDSGTNNDPFSRLRTQSLEELSGLFDWSDSAASFITPRATYRTVFQSLLNHAYWFDAANMLSHAMPQREAVWWAARVCDDHMAVDETDDGTRAQQVALLEDARKWVSEPEEELRMQIYKAAALIPNRVPAHWVGMAIFWSMGNITPDAGVVTNPPPHLYARGVSAAVDLAAALTCAGRDAFYQEALGRGMDIASGGNGDSVATL